MTKLGEGEEEGLVEEQLNTGAVPRGVHARQEADSGVKRALEKNVHKMEKISLQGDKAKEK